MLFRVAGKVIGGKPFTARLESANIIGALSTARTALNETGVADDQIAELRARPVEGGSAIRFGKPKDPNAPKRERKAKANGSTAGAAKK
jgi:hypothetical protein